MSPPNRLSLAGFHRDRQIEELLDRLKTQEADGDIVGLITITMCRKGKKKEFYLSVAGWPESNPTLGLGAMASCQALLAEYVLQQAGLTPE